ncbi:deleted in malignant brain tumors 1 protein-like isoform X2 [Oscarella lobularis]
MENGTKSTNETAVNAVVKFMCEEGYVLHGAASVVCQENGSWSNRLPSCVKDQPYSVRLTGSSRSNEGRVELYYNGEWGTVCDTDWDLQDSNVVCHQLGLGRALTYSNSIPGKGSILLSGVRCNGSEEGLAQCLSDGIFRRTSGSCSHSEDVYISCREGRCSELHVPLSSAEISGNATTTNVTFSCQSRSELSGPLSVSCLEDGTWSDDAPVCIVDVWKCEERKCVFPFTYKGVEWNSCTNIDHNQPWCATKPGAYEDHKSWRNCPCQDEKEEDLGETRTCGGTGGGAPCKFPFTYKGKVYQACTTYDAEKPDLPWCMTDRYKWGNCRCCLCPPKLQDIRLVGGSSKYEGQIEGYYENGLWALVCDKDFGMEEAFVVCRELFSTPPARFTVGYSFQSGPSSFVLEIRCSGKEFRLQECSHGNSGLCSVRNTAGVVCLDQPFPVRLTGSSRSNEGRVELYYNGEWGTVCDTDWDLQDSNVVCRQFGLGRALTYSNSIPGKGSILLSGVRCNGSEEGLAQCLSDGIFRRTSGSCSHSNDVYISCREGRCSELRVPLSSAEISGNATTTNVTFSCRSRSELSGPLSVSCLEDGTWSNDAPVCILDVRLVGGLSKYEGQLEAYYDDRWALVCDKDFGMEEAFVVCRELFSTPPARFTVGYSFESGPSLLVLEIRCPGKEFRLQECSHGSSGLCSVRNTAGVVCLDQPFPVRLTGSSRSNEGRVELYYNGEWGTVCDTDWDLRDSNVVCRQLGLGRALTYSNSIPGKGSILLSGVRCNGSEEGLAQCLSGGIFRRTSGNCSHSDDVYISCEDGRCSELHVPLSSAEISGNATTTKVTFSCQSRSELSGPVSVSCLEDGTWSVCISEWHNCTSEDNNQHWCATELGTYEDRKYSGNFSCQEERAEDLGKTRTCGGTGGGAPCKFPFIYKSKVYESCTTCDAVKPGLPWCSTGSGTWGSCRCCTCRPKDQPFPVRLTGSSRSNEGRVELYYNGEWGTVCDTDWDLRDSNVVCRQLGLGRALTYSNSIPGKGSILLSGVRCNGSEEGLAQCLSDGVFRRTSGNCSHSDDVYISCEDGRCLELYVYLSSAEVSGNADTTNVIFSCKSGYKLTGPMRVSCLENSTWSDDTPECIPACPDMFGLWNLTLTVSSETQKDEENFSTTKVNFACDNGYILTGPSSIWCLESSQWSEDAPRCVPVSLAIPILTLLLFLIVSGLTIRFTNNFKFIFSLRGIYYLLLTASSFLFAILIATYFGPYSTPLVVEAVVNADTVLCLSPFFTQTLFHLIGNSINRQARKFMFIAFIVIVEIVIGVLSSFIFSDSDCSEGDTFSSIVLSYWLNGALAMGSGLVIWITYFKEYKHRPKCQSFLECLTLTFLAALYLSALVTVTFEHDCKIQHHFMIVLATFPALLTLHVLTFKLIKDVFAKKYTSGTNLPIELSFRSASGSSLKNNAAEVDQVVYWDEDIVQQISAVIISPSRIQKEAWIGRGNFGAVFKGTMNNAVVAMKSVLDEMNRREVNDFVREGLRMRQFDHPNVIKLLGICWSDNPSNPYHRSPLIILPYMELGDLKMYLRKCRPGEPAASVQDKIPLQGKIGLIQLVKFSLQIASGMEYISNKGVVHRDLAARNCMVSWSLEVKVGDFGLSKVLAAGKDYYRASEGGALPIRWMSPECLLDFVFTPKSDVWSFGITVWEVMTLGMVPYPGTSNQEVISFVKSGQRLAKPEECPLEVYNMMLSCWSVKPENRLSFTKIVDFLEDYLTEKMNYFNVNSDEDDPYALEPGCQRKL